MLLHKKSVPFMNGTFKCHDYSTIIDVEVYKGGYDNYYCNIFYTTPGDVSMSEGKEVFMMVLSEKDFENSDTDRKEGDTHEKVVVPDDYRFLKSVELGDSRVTYRYFIFVHEKLSISESRDVRIGEII